MTDIVIAWREEWHFRKPSTLPYQEDDRRKSDYLQLHQGYRPMWLKHVRIYERTMGVDEAALLVLRDAIAEGSPDSADAVFREYGSVGWWRPSTIIVERVTVQASQRITAQGVVAHALWNTDLHLASGPNDAIRLELCNDEDRERFVRPHLVFTEMTDRELNIPPGNERAREDGSWEATAPELQQLQQRIAQLERRIGRR